MYDLVLSRLDHDMMFSPKVMGDGSTRYEFWIFDSADRVAQQIKINLLSFLGEWFLDNTYGVPYLEDILIKNPRMTTVETIMRNHINSVPNVTSVDALSLDWDRRGRTLRVDFSASTDMGPITESFKLEIPRGV